LSNALTNNSVLLYGVPSFSNIVLINLIAAFLVFVSIPALLLYHLFSIWLGASCDTGSTILALLSSTNIFTYPNSNLLNAFTKPGIKLGLFFSASLTCAICGSYDATASSLAIMLPSFVWLDNIIISLPAIVWPSNVLSICVVPYFSDCHVVLPNISVVGVVKLDINCFILLGRESIPPSSVKSMSQFALNTSASSSTYLYWAFTLSNKEDLSNSGDSSITFCLKANLACSTTCLNSSFVYVLLGSTKDLIVIPSIYLSNIWFNASVTSSVNISPSFSCANNCDSKSNLTPLLRFLTSRLAISSPSSLRNCCSNSSAV